MLSTPGPGHLVSGRYRLVDQLGRGAMGIVWRGRDELLDRDVAVKQIVMTAMASATEAEASYQRTLREARTAARLSHPGVVTVFDVVEDGGAPWIVMELISARPLDQVIAEDGPLPPAQATQLGLSLLDALATAHAAGVLHRDVKPSNVLISPAGKAILTDFGIATFQGDPSMTQAGMVVGTPGFSPPERVRGAAATTASDLWSLGATLYAAVEGRGPFDRAGGSMAIVASIATEPAPRAPSAGPLAPVIDALLRANPAERPDAAATAAMLTEALAAARTVGELTPAALAASSAGMDATTATQVVGVRIATDLASGATTNSTMALRAGVKDHAEPVASVASPVGTSARLAATGSVLEPAGAAIGVVPDLMATPVFAELKMPAPPSGPANLFGPYAGGTPSAGGAGGADEHGADGTPDLDGVLHQSGPPRQRDARSGPGSSHDGLSAGTPPQSRRVVVLAWAAAASVAVIVAVFLTFPNLGDSVVHGFSRLPGGSALGAGPTGKASVGSQTGHTKGGSVGTHRPTGQPTPAASRGQSPQPTPSGAKHGSGKPSPSGKPTKSGKPSPSSSPSQSPSPSPSPSPSQSVATLPAGYAWQSESAATAGSTAGFQLAAPATWLMTTGLDTYIKPALGAVRLGVNMTPFHFPAPVRQARYLQKFAITHHAYRSYHLVSILAMRFHGSAAATWIFWFKPLTALHRIDVSEVLFTANTSAGPQSYILSMSAPATRVAWAGHVFRVAMRTFSPQP